MAPEFTDRDQEPDEVERPIKVSRTSPGAAARSRRRCARRHRPLDRDVRLSASDRPVDEQGVGGRMRRSRSPPTRSRPGSVSPALAAHGVRSIRGAEHAPRSQASAAEPGPELDRLTRGRTAAATSARLPHRASDSSATRASRSSPSRSWASPSALPQGGGPTWRAHGERVRRQCRRDAGAKRRGRRAHGVGRPAR